MNDVYIFVLTLAWTVNAIVAFNGYIQVPVGEQFQGSVSLDARAQYNVTIGGSPESRYIATIAIEVGTRDSKKAIKVFVVGDDYLAALQIPYNGTKNTIVTKVADTLCLSGKGSIQVDVTSHSSDITVFWVTVTARLEMYNIVKENFKEHFVLDQFVPYYLMYCWPESAHNESVDHGLLNSVQIALTSDDQQCIDVAIFPGTICSHQGNKAISSDLQRFDQTMTSSATTVISRKSLNYVDCFHITMRLAPTNVKCLRDDGDENLRHHDATLQIPKNMTVDVTTIHAENYFALVYFALIVCGSGLLFLVVCSTPRMTRILRYPVLEEKTMDECFLVGRQVPRYSYIITVLVIAAFYSLPSLQLLLYNMNVIRLTGNLDLCYYNFRCARPLGPFVAFNNVFSNFSYVVYGFIFIYIVHARRVHARYGEVLYTMGIALVLEGFMSACYHICPQNSNFQFDTTTMYIISGLCMYYLHYVRNPYKSLQAYWFFAIFAIIITVVVFSIAAQRFEWMVFMTFVYSLTVISFGIGVFGVLYVDTEWTNGHPHVQRLMAGVHGTVNLALLGYSLYKLYEDQSAFPTVLLNMFVGNLLLFTLFYMAMKRLKSETIVMAPLLCLVASMASWTASLYFYNARVSDWRESPAVSRESNKECVFLGFFDSHDVWHLLSGLSLLISFLLLLTVDDGQNLVTRPRHRNRRGMQDIKQYNRTESSKSSSATRVLMYQSA